MRQLAERPRALRYELSAPLVYRCVGEAHWQKGRTENISRSGVLFQATVPVLPASTRIEFIVKLPDLEPPGGSWVQCRGRVVRHGSAAAVGACTMAATIDEYTFLGSGQSVRSESGGTVTAAAFEDVRVSAEPVVNFAIGGRVDLSPRWKLHAGAYTDFSPAPEEGMVFDQVDLYGLTLGVSFEVRRNTYWVIGLNYLHGSRGDLPVRDLATGALVPTDVAINTIGAVLGTTLEF